MATEVRAVCLLWPCVSTHHRKHQQSPNGASRRTLKKASDETPSLNAAIVGRALYEGTLTVAEAVAATR
jgi:phosphoribosylformimino-5-aminoimidazole carboxamide ribonucleotide (ProFAR) isomerase